MPQDVTPIISALARKYNLDPAAVLAVARGEGGTGYGRVGDGGHAFGPFQMNDAGGVLTGRAGDHAAFANSPQGLEFALSGMAKAGASGLTGRAAVERIINSYERPADKQTSIRNALGRLGGGGYAQAQGGVMPPAQAQAPVPQGPQAIGPDLRQQVLLSLLAQRRSGSTDRSPVLAALAQMHQQPRTPGAPAHAVSGPARARTQDAPGEGWQKWVGQPEHRSGPSAPHTQEILQFVGKVGQIAQTRLTPLGNESHSLTTVDGIRSAHADGMAADIPATGDELIRLGQDALIAAGMPPAKAREQTGGLFNVGGHQIIFNTHVGGDHTNHVHVGIRR